MFSFGSLFPELPENSQFFYKILQNHNNAKTNIVQCRSQEARFKRFQYYHNYQRKLKVLQKRILY